MKKLLLLIGLLNLSPGVFAEPMVVPVNIEPPAPVTLQAEVVKTDTQLLIDGNQQSLDKILGIMAMQVQSTNRQLERMIEIQGELVLTMESNQTKQAENCRKKSFWEKIGGL